MFDIPMPRDAASPRRRSRCRRLSPSGRDAPRWCRAPRRRSAPGRDGRRSTGPPAQPGRSSGGQPDRAPSPAAAFRRVNLTSRAGLKTECFTLTPKEGDQPAFSIGGPAAGRASPPFRSSLRARRCGPARARRAHRGVALEPCLRGRPGRLDHEQLLLDRVVKVARQPRAFLLPCRLADLLLVLRSQPGSRPCCGWRTRVRRPGPWRAAATPGAKSAPGPVIARYSSTKPGNECRSRRGAAGAV